MMGPMTSESLSDPAAPTDAANAVHVVTYLMSAPENGDVETGAVLLDQRPIGRLSRRRRPGIGPRLADGSAVTEDSVWHAEAVGWLPNAGRPWDTRVTSTAPTRLRAAEDLLRAYRNHR